MLITGKIFVNTKNRSKFVIVCDMKNDLTCRFALTEIEAELICAIRNYVRSYPNGHPELLWYAQKIFDELVEPFKEMEVADLWK